CTFSGSVILHESRRGREEGCCLRAATDEKNTRASLLSGRREPIWRSVDRFFERELKLGQLFFYLPSCLRWRGKRIFTTKCCTKDVHRPEVGEGAGDAVKFFHAVAFYDNLFRPPNPTRNVCVCFRARVFMPLWMLLLLL
ncbi:unnamed protein product, partial [Ectocarpus sp. 12 AP-2014]